MCFNGSNNKTLQIAAKPLLICAKEIVEIVHQPKPFLTIEVYIC
jgi:hypothetical protein